MPSLLIVLQESDLRLKAADCRSTDRFVVNPPHSEPQCGRIMRPQPIRELVCPPRQILTHSSGRDANVSVACVTVLLHGQPSAAPSGSLDTDRTPDSLNLQVEGREPLGHFRPIRNRDHFSSENLRVKLGHSKLSSQVSAGAARLPRLAPSPSTSRHFARSPESAVAT